MILPPSAPSKQVTIDTSWGKGRFVNMNIGEGESHSRTMEVIGKMHGRNLCTCAVQRFQWMTVSLFVTPYENVCCPVALSPLENVKAIVHDETRLASGNDAWLFLITHGTSPASAQKDLVSGRFRDYFHICHPMRHDSNL